MCERRKESVLEVSLFHYALHEVLFGRNAMRSMGGVASLGGKALSLAIVPLCCEFIRFVLDDHLFQILSMMGEFVALTSWNWEVMTDWASQSTRSPLSTNTQHGGKNNMLLAATMNATVQFRSIRYDMLLFRRTHSIHTESELGNVVHNHIVHNGKELNEDDSDKAQIRCRDISRFQAVLAILLIHVICTAHFRTLFFCQVP